MLNTLQANAVAAAGNTADMDATEDQLSFSSWEFDDDDENILPVDEAAVPTLPILPLIPFVECCSPYRPTTQGILARVRKCVSDLDLVMKDKRTTTTSLPPPPPANPVAAAPAQAATHKGLISRMQGIRRMPEEEEKTMDTGRRTAPRVTRHILPPRARHPASQGGYGCYGRSIILQ